MTEQQPITAEHFLYGRPGAEELGDVIWYVDRLLMMVGATVDQAMQANLDKLRRRLRHQVSLDAKQRPKVTPRLTVGHPLRDWLWELGEFARARCSRCSTTSPGMGLLQAYWGAWLCTGCADELGRVGGELDRNGWPGSVAA